MRKNRKMLALILCFAIVFVLLFSLFYIAKESHHNCTGGSCPICQRIEVCLQSINCIGSALIVIFSVLAFFSCIVNSAAAILNKNIPNTLVNLKVKLTN